MVGEVIYAASFVAQLNQLSKVLYDDNYFSFVEDAEHYTDNIYDFIEHTIEKPVVVYSPPRFRKFGRKYLRYRANRHTTWYIFFDQKDHRFLINYIINNHSGYFAELL